MAIHTYDPELSDALEVLKVKFPNNLLHGECLRKDYPNNHQEIDCNGTAMIVWNSKIGDNECLDYCRKSEIERLKK